MKELAAGSQCWATHWCVQRTDEEGLELHYTQNNQNHYERVHWFTSLKDCFFCLFVCFVFLLFLRDVCTYPPNKILRNPQQLVWAGKITAQFNAQTSTKLHGTFWCINTPSAADANGCCHMLIKFNFIVNWFWAVCHTHHISHNHLDASHTASSVFLTGNPLGRLTFLVPFLLQTTTAKVIRMLLFDVPPLWFTQLNPLG